jgi:5S rRNA maturation endonuclease (ribonuclease M5)
MLPSSSERRFEAIIRLLDRLDRASKMGVPILVEGRKDRLAIERLGIEGEVIPIKNTGNVLTDVLDRIQSPNTIILVDFDPEGVALAKKIAAYFERSGVNADLTFWRGIGSLVRREAKDVEGLPSFLENLKKRAST